MSAASAPALIIAGPTCSGKSALAIALAQRFDGVVINADAMQLYRELRILTARPTEADERRVPHALYGVRQAREIGTAAWWRSAALDTIARVHRDGRMPILCGGSGMYLSALVDGIADIPDPGTARDEARDLLAVLGAEGLHARLSEVDALTASRLSPHDSQRVARAWEVWRATGTGLATWWQSAKTPPAQRTIAVIIAPPRACLKTAIETRFAAMLASGAVAEVEALRTMDLDPSLPIMRAHGVAELGDYLDGRSTLDDAAQRACSATVRYTRRQSTWFKHHTLAPTATYTICSRIAGMQQFSESEMAKLHNFVATAIDGGTTPS